ncbi:hypothetical protein AGOR_G00093010 [Albula goreensis]|uniref:Uncharacterized protein n=1 Tax=Albula goreensis TaxID=1534307 RepID=A0A8T3DK86_9TELE|nr:hypothetical protein AGOR_G00093010 [Albula goreensis]
MERTQVPHSISLGRHTARTITEMPSLVRGFSNAAWTGMRDFFESAPDALPDDCVPLSVRDLGVAGEEDGVVGNHRVTVGQDSSGHVTHRVQDTVIHQQVIHQQLFR